MSWLNSQWYSKKTSIAWKLLIPLEALYRGLIFLRKIAYRFALFKSHRLPVPVIIVGNISVGGVGKTPLTVELVNFFKSNNYRPGIVSRGYKGKASTWPQIVDEKSDPILVGDEPVLLAQKTSCPIVVGPNRVEAARKLLEKYKVDLIIADDGLQHYALARDIEIVVMDAERLFGNGHCLPYGPLREPSTRLKTVDFIVRTESMAPQSSRDSFAGPIFAVKMDPSALPRDDGGAGEYAMKFQIADLFRLNNPTEKKSLNEFKNQPIHAFAGIGNPKRFFEMLKQNGLQIIEHAFPDHYQFQTKDFLNIAPNDLILMTEKDAVKCRFLNDPRIWVLPIKAKLPPEFFSALQKKLQKLPASTHPVENIPEI